MNQLMKTTLAGLFFLAASANASLETDIQQIRALLPADTDVAQIQASVLNGSSEAEALDAAKANYLIRDINGDGQPDVLVISEEKPRLENYETNQPCASVNEDNCGLVYGKRALRLFYGQANGEMKPVFTNETLILGADDGGIFGDPLQGLGVTKTGAIQYSVYGGSAWRWSFTETFQFRNGDLFVIGSDSYSGWNVDLRADTKSINFITGRVVETHQKNADARVHTKASHVPVKPLVKVADYAGNSEQ